MLNLQPNNRFKEKIEKKANIARSSRRKGRSAESEVGRILSYWYGVPESFSPSRSSGANLKIGQPGDILAPNGFKFVIEVKNTEGWNLTQIFQPLNCHAKLVTFWKFWKQAKEACDEYNKKKPTSLPIKYPVLIFTRNREEFFIMYEIKHCATKCRNRILIQFINEDLMICQLSDFLDNAPINELFV